MVQSRGQVHLPPSVKAPAERGAVLLLSIYLLSMSFLVLAGVSLQRTLQETQLSTRSAQTQQALWLAEGGLEGVLRALRTSLPTLDVEIPSSLSGASYRVSRKVTDPSGQYLITSTGTIQNVSQRVYVLVDVGPPRIDFRYAGFWGDGAYLSRAIVGGIDTDTTPAVIKHPLILGGPSPSLQSPTTGHGDIGTNATAPNSIEVRHATVDGNILVGAGASDPSQVVQIVDSTVTGQVKPLADPMTFPPIVVPSVPLLNELRNLTLIGQKKCLSPGTYSATSIFLYPDTKTGQTSELCTTGPVDLYVTGPIEVARYSQLYGQPAGNAPFQQHYSPKNLRIFAVPKNPGDEVSFKRASVAAAALYAPDMPVRFVRGNVFMGSIIGKIGRLSRQAAFDTAPNRPKIYHDAALDRLTIRVNSTGTKVTVLWYGTSPPATPP